MKAEQARELVNAILDDRGGASVIYTMHAVERMAQRDIKESDVVQALRADDLIALENTTRDAKFRVRDEDFGVVFAFQDGRLIIIVTAWREEPKL